MKIDGTLTYPKCHWWRLPSNFFSIFFVSELSTLNIFFVSDDRSRLFMSTARANLPAPNFNFPNIRYPIKPTNYPYTGGVSCNHNFEFLKTEQIRRGDEMASTLEKCTLCGFVCIRHC